MDIDHIEAEVEVLAELAVFDHGGEVFVSCGDDADIDFDGGVAADAFDGAFAEGAEELDLSALVDFAEFVEEERAAVGGFEAADAAFGGTGEGAAFVAEEFAFEQLWGEGGAVDDDEFGFGSAAEVVEGVGDEFLAGTAFAFDEDGGACGSDLLDAFEDPLHGGGIAEELVEAEAVVDLALEGSVFLFEVSAAEGAADEEVEFLDIDWFGDEVPCPAAHGFDGGVDAAVGGHHDDDWGVREGEGGVDELHAVVGTEAEVGDHDVDAFVFEDFEGFGAVGGDVDVEVVFEGHAETVAGVFFVVDDENGGVHEWGREREGRGKMGQTDTEATACWGTDGGSIWGVAGGECAAYAEGYADHSGQRRRHYDHGTQDIPAADG